MDGAAVRIDEKSIPQKRSPRQWLWHAVERSEYDHVVTMGLFKGLEFRRNRCVRRLGAAQEHGAVAERVAEEGMERPCVALGAAQHRDLVRLIDVDANKQAAVAAPTVGMLDRRYFSDVRIRWVLRSGAAGHLDGRPPGQQRGQHHHL